MNFDIRSMKQRAKALMKTTSPNPKAVGIIFMLVLMLFYASIIASCVTQKYIILPIAELVCMNFRNCSKLYGLKVSREEKTGVSDAFSAFKESPVQMIILCVVKDICYAVGLCFLLVGAVIPFYCLRFSCHIIKDEKVNAFKAMRRSSVLLKGHYIELFKLDMHVILHYILFLCFCLNGFYVKPYAGILYAEFYDYLKACKEMTL